MKRRIKFSKKTFLIEQVSVIIENIAVVKFKDLGYLIVSVKKGDTYVEKALLDLEATVSLVPYSLYK